MGGARVKVNGSASLAHDHWRCSCGGAQASSDLQTTETRDRFAAEIGVFFGQFFSFLSSPATRHISPQSTLLYLLSQTTGPQLSVRNCQHTRQESQPMSPLPNFLGTYLRYLPTDATCPSLEVFRLFCDIREVKTIRTRNRCRSFETIWDGARGFQACQASELMHIGRRPQIIPPYCCSSRFLSMFLALPDSVTSFPAPQRSCHGGMCTSQPPLQALYHRHQAFG
ncbi:hypothetical protein B0H63DRAFT_61335 [Podospora didyma]|uniref:Uncharacterized protein n=1 Tax=Podospora didyma TaxID=330526 RepID=A0AAE0U8W3_9PEZI|nr:hypothetical protein B0H63DRAFT_61335 [Podospora didyma]